MLWPRSCSSSRSLPVLSWIGVFRDRSRLQQHNHQVGSCTRLHTFRTQGQRFVLCREGDQSANKQLGEPGQIITTRGDDFRKRQNSSEEVASPGSLRSTSVAGVIRSPPDRRPRLVFLSTYMSRRTSGA